ncbi:exodeoxyribonuclease VII large subunit [Rhodobacteraceae bacterium CCMM004]|nr:exodeoxyribonuclease VII large subunit [Rhodobacteraceae bacterium CCMM004]
MDLIDDPRPGENAHDYTVSEISGAVKKVLEGEFGRIRVRGEVGRVFRARSGHLYFDLKDDRNVLASVAWKGQIARLTAAPEEGMEVVAMGRLTTFGSQSKYQLTVDDLRPAGVGALMAMLEKRKKALEAEGLFDPARKRPLPYLPEVIGVVTSPGGAVIRDILHRLRDRFPRKVLVWPVAVQGAACAPEVARAIAGFNRLSPGGAVPRPDLIIVARGGGSIEDLWGFNEEIVARAAAESAIPLISAVGHETDTTLIDYVADRRAPTPTAAAEMAVPVRLELMAWLDGQGARMSGAVGRGVAQRRQRLGDLSRGLPRPEGLTAQARQRLDWAADRLPRALTAGVERRQARLATLAVTLRPGALARRIADHRRAVDRTAQRLLPALARAVSRRHDMLDRAAARLVPRNLARRAAQGQERLNDRGRSLDRAMAARLERLEQRLAAQGRLLTSLGYEATLHRGYAVVRADGAVAMDKSAAEGARSLEIQFRDGRLTLGAPPRRKSASPPKGQGELF